MVFASTSRVELPAEAPAAAAKYICTMSRHLQRCGEGTVACIGDAEVPGLSPGRKPEWLKKPLPRADTVRRLEDLLQAHRLRTICESARCPNKGECFERGTATFLILGDVCSRDCRFCSVPSGVPAAVDAEEPHWVAEASAVLGLSHIVITSVTRDDLADGGAAQFVATIRTVRERLPAAAVEVLVPDFGGRRDALRLVLEEAPEVFNHNLETVPRLYPVVRPQADFARSMEVLRRAAEYGQSVVKTGFMVGLGERPEEVGSLLEEIWRTGCQVVTIGQYLQPTKAHLPVREYVPPPVFENYEALGEALGLLVEAAPFVRSSYRADEGFDKFSHR